MYNLLLSTQPEYDPNKSFFELGKTLVTNSKLTRGMQFILIFDIIYLGFVLLCVTFPPLLTAILTLFGLSPAPFPANQLITSVYVLVGFNFIYFILYEIPEIMDRWKR